MIEIRNQVRLPSVREEITLQTSDGLELVGELALPAHGEPVATLVTLHPLPTHGGYMDSHLYRKAANRLPQLANVAVLRFNSRGTSSPRGTSQGSFDEGISEKFDLEAAVAFVKERKLPNIWLVGWSFGTELVLKYGRLPGVVGGILLSPPLHRATKTDIAAWEGSGKRLVVMVPGEDDYLKPPEAKAEFAVCPSAQLIAVPGARHLWVGENSTRKVLNTIVATVAPASAPLPETWDESASGF